MTSSKNFFLEKVGYLDGYQGKKTWSDLHSSIKSYWDLRNFFKVCLRFFRTWKIFTPFFPSKTKSPPERGQNKNFHYFWCLYQNAPFFTLIILSPTLKITKIFQCGSNSDVIKNIFWGNVQHNSGQLLVKTRRFYHSCTKSY